MEAHGEEGQEEGETEARTVGEGTTRGGRKVLSQFTDICNSAEIVEYLLRATTYFIGLRVFLFHARFLVSNYAMQYIAYIYSVYTVYI